MSPLRDWPIKRKLTAILLLISGLVLVLTSAAFVTHQVVTFRGTVPSHLATRSRILAANSTAALAFANEADATEILAALKYDPHMVAAALYNQDGRVLATYPVAATADLIPAAPQPDGYRFEGGRLVGSTPVAQGGKRLGTLYIGSDTKDVSDALRLSGVIAIVVLAIAMLAAYALAAALQGRISAPKFALAETATAVSTRQDYSVRAPKLGEDQLGTLTDAFKQMLVLIDDLLNLARVTRAEMRTEVVDLSGMARDIVAELQRATPERHVEFAIAPGLEARGDPRLLRVALDNLLRNGWKYTAKQPRAQIEFASTNVNGERAFVVRDNGAGFDMQYADKLFGGIQRLPSAAEFEGTGVGLATVRRIITRHGGRIWAEGGVDRGATFYFTL